MEEVEVIFGRSDAISGSAIRMFTWSDWNHCGVVVNGTVYEATTQDGVTTSSLDYFKKRYPNHVIMRAPARHGWEERMKSQLGKKYDWGAIYSLVFRRDWSDNTEWYCSEYVAFILGIFNVQYLNRVTPQHIVQISF